MTLRILHAMAGAEVGGAEAFFVRLVLGLHKAGEPQRAVIRTHPNRADALRQAGVEVVETRFGGMFDFSTLPALRREIADFEPDIVMSWMSRAAHFVGGLGGRLGNDRKFVHVARLGGYYKLKYYRGCDHLVGNTPDIVDYLLREGWPAERAHYVPNFVDARPAPPVRRADLDTPDEAPVLLVLGRLHTNKAIDVAIRALADIPHAYLWIAGEGPLRAELETLARQSGTERRVRFLGWRDDAQALLAAADVLLCPSRHEPLGNVVIEAWAHGVPVVAADSAGPKWLIKNREYGLLVPRDDVQAFAAAVREVLADIRLRERLVDGGRVAYETQFTEQAVIARYRDLFAGLSR